MTVKDYIASVPEERAPYFNKLRKTIKANLPKGFKECINYKMLGYVVPQSTYPDADLYEWFTSSYPDHAKYKLDMGKSCVRFKRMDDIPYDLVGELVSKMSVEDWISIYEAQIKK